MMNKLPNNEVLKVLSNVTNKFPFNFPFPSFVTQKVSNGSCKNMVTHNQVSHKRDSRNVSQMLTFDMLTERFP